MWVVLSIPHTFFFFAAFDYDICKTFVQSVQYLCVEQFTVILVTENWLEHTV